MKAFTFEAIGTRWVIEIFDDLPQTDFTRLESQFHERIEEFDKLYSRFRQDSLVTQMAHTPGEFVLPSDGIAMVKLAEKLYQLTDGLFTPLIGSVLEDAGYDSKYSLQAKKLHRPKSWEDTLAVSGSKILLKEPALLDLGALGKGKLIDVLSEILDKQQISSYTIDGGGDIKYKGTKQLRIGLEHPENPQQVIGVVKFKNQSIAASAGNRRAWGQYHHIINPQSLSSPTDVLATWVIAPEAMLADALATALFLVPPAKLIPHFSFAYLRLYPNYSFEKSEDFPAELYYT